MTKDQLADWWMKAIDDPIWTTEARRHIARTVYFLRGQPEPETCPHCDNPIEDGEEHCSLCRRKL